MKVRRVNARGDIEIVRKINVEQNATFAEPELWCAIQGVIMILRSFLLDRV